MLKPLQSDEQLIADIKSYKGAANQFKIWWLAQSGFLIKFQDKTILFDPYLSDSLTVKYLTTNKPHTRISEIVVDPKLLDMINIVTSSHNHTDHLDAQTLIPIFEANPTIHFVIPEANLVFVEERLKCDILMPIGLNDGLSIKLHDFEIIGLPAAHNEIERDQNGQLKCMGFVVKFGDFSIYHSGDTLWFPALVDLLKPYNVDVAFLPINGNLPSRGVAGNLNCEEAARLGKEIRANLVIPHHYDLFEFNTANPKDFEVECLKLNTSYKIMQLGEGYVYEKCF
jgi:L-ascorbate metabolism protein UlaG (beta-lactamase superfamily)